MILEGGGKPNKRAANFETPPAAGKIQVNKGLHYHPEAAAAAAAAAADAAHDIGPASVLALPLVAISVQAAATPPWLLCSALQLAATSNGGGGGEWSKLARTADCESISHLAGAAIVRGHLSPLASAPPHWTRGGAPAGRVAALKLGL